MSEENPSQSEIKESINKLAKKMEQKIIEDSRKKIFAGFPVEEVTELDWHRREKEQQASYKDLMDEVAAQEAKDKIWQRARWEERRQRARWEERRQRPIRQAEEYLASCSDEKDAESCAFWKARREKLFEEHMERARVLAEADAAHICKRSLPQDPDLLNFVDLQATNFNTEIKDVDLGDLTGEEWISPVFPPVAFKGVVLPPLQARDAWVDEMSKALSQFPQADAEDWKDSWDGKISLEKHLARTKHMSDMIDTQYQENKHLIITNRVLTILLIFSTAFGITAALAWLRCQ